MAERSKPPKGSGAGGGFENLYRLVPLFEAHNWTTFLGRAERFDGHGLALTVGDAFKSGDLRELDPYWLDIIKSTLAPACCTAFFRTSPQLPFVERDYYLSKIFQYISAAIVYGGFELVGDWQARLTAALEQIPNETLPALHELFSIERFFFWSRPFVDDGADFSKSLGLLSFLDDPPPAIRKACISDRLGTRLKELHEESSLTWDTIAKETGISRRWLKTRFGDAAPPASFHFNVAKDRF